ncbi:MAG TPA: FAD-dependent oxidoreductase [Streptosporangiaceae bacterium]|jgi:D-amino-acid oxidase
MTTTNDQVIVVGAGVSGLTTALCLTDAGRSVRVLAAAPPRETTSMVPGALWGPCFAEPVERTLAWTERSLADFRALAAEPSSGVRMAPAVSVGALPPGSALPPQVRLIPELREARPEELPAGYASGFRALMVAVDMPRYLDFLTGRLAAAGVAIEVRRVASFGELGGEAAAVVNCAGLGARELAADAELGPDFGQEVVLSNPGLETVFIDLTPGTESTIFVPHPDRVVCGGVSRPGRWDTTPDPEVTEAILERCRAAEPRLRDAEVLDVLTGLRPSRPAVRVEAEDVDGLRVVHNYGHGAHGVSLSWGCARDAARLAG